MKRLFLFLTPFTLLLFFGATAAWSANLQNAGTNLRDVASRAGTTEGSLETVTGQLIAAALTLVGIIFLVLMVYAGYLWLTARGEEEPVTKAKTIISGSIIGLVIVLSANAIAVFVTGRFERGSVQGEEQLLCCRYMDAAGEPILATVFSAEECAAACDVGQVTGCQLVSLPADTCH